MVASSRYSRVPHRAHPRRLAALVAVGLLVGAPAASAAAITTLMDAFQLAVASDPQYLAAAAANRAAQEAIPQARAALLPSLDASVSGTLNELDVRGTSTNTGLGNSEFKSSQIDLTLTQPLYHKDLWIALAQADQRVKRANVDYAYARQSLMLRVAQAYFNVLSAGEDLTFAKTARQAFGQQLKQAQQRFEVGLIAITDVEEAKSGYDQASAQVISAENQLDNTREALREVTGEYHPKLDGLGDKMPLVAPDPNDIDAWTRTALKQNLQLTSARIAADTARDEIKRVEAGHLPTLDLVGGHTRSSSDGGVSSLLSSNETTIGLRLQVPIYSGGSVVSRTRQSRALYQQAEDVLEQQRRATHRAARDAFLGVMSDISKVKALEQALRSTQSARAAVEAGFQVGTRTSVDVLNADRDVFQTRRDLAVARYTYIIDVLRLKLAAGTLSEDDLQRVNTWLR